MPSHNIVPMGFAFDLAMLCGFSTAALPEGTAFVPSLCEGTYIHTMRQDLLARAVEIEADWMLWLDTDMRFPRDALVRLLKHKKEIVGINYAHRKMPVDYVAIKRCSASAEEPAEKLRTTRESTGLEEAEAIGFGMVLMDVPKVVNLIGKPPWFRNEWNPDMKRWVGEDVYFCKRARDAGLKIWVDHDLSKLCAHSGSFDYKCEHATAWQEEFAGADSGEVEGGRGTAPALVK